jgi:predicted lipoprotein
MGAARSPESFMKPHAVILALVVLAAGVTWRFPLFHVVPLKASHATQRQAAFDAAKFAEDFWVTRLTPHLDDAADATAVLAALAADPTEARRRYGRTVGVSRSAFFLLRGRGTIVAVDKRRIGVALEDDATAPALWLSTGPIFGNAVRDASGLLRTGDFSNSQHFNSLSAELNRLVEERVLPLLVKQASPGKRIQFVCCAETVGRTTEPLTAVPLQVTID